MKRGNAQPARLNLGRFLSFLPGLLCTVRAAGAPVLEVEAVLADGKPVAFSREAGVVLPAGRHDLEIRFRALGDAPQVWVVKYQFAGYDPTWRSVDGEMALLVRVLDGEERRRVRNAG